jgi:hypothetical protein
MSLPDFCLTNDAEAPRSLRRISQGEKPSKAPLLINIGRSECSAEPVGQLGDDNARWLRVLASKELDRRVDHSLPAEEQERRKRQLTKGPKEFRDIRDDLPKRKA